MAAVKEKPKREAGFSIYPPPDMLAEIEKLADQEDRKRSPMALRLIREALEARKRKTK